MIIPLPKTPDNQSDKSKKHIFLNKTVKQIVNLKNL
jgi:hypothetical protein